MGEQAMYEWIMTDSGQDLYVDGKIVGSVTMYGSVFHGFVKEPERFREVGKSHYEATAMALVSQAHQKAIDQA
jgi:hypothetical protein